MKLIKALLLTLPMTLLANDKVILTKENTVVLNKVFTGESVANLTVEAKALDSSSSSKEPIYLVINSPGGMIDAGIELIENLSAMNRPVKTINLWSASMGFHTAQGLEERLITKDGTLMSHKASGGFSGEFPGQLDSRYGYYLKRVLRLDEKVVLRTNGKHTLESYRNLTENEFWCDGQDCVDQGLADRVIVATCDASLKGTENVSIEKFMIFGKSVDIVAVMDKCPLNTNALKYEVYVDGSPLFKAAPQEKVWYDFSIGSYTPALSSEVLFEINNKVNSSIERFKTKQVIKGY